MIKRLQKHGNSHVLVIEKSLMKAIGITPNAPLQITISGNSLIVTAANIDVGRDVIATSIRKIRARYRKMLKKLAE